MTEAHLQKSPRFELKILGYKNHSKISDVCQLLYESKDQNLLASISSTPYTVGRSFSNDELEKIHQILKSWEVHHSFTSSDSEAKIMEFNPDSESLKKEDTKSNSAKTKGQSSNLKFIFFGAAGLLLLLGIYALITTLNRPSNRSTESYSEAQKNSDATLVNFSNRVEHRPRGGFNWNGAHQNLGLKNKDAIRTYQSARAKIKYSTGSQIFVKENTFLIIGESQESEGRKKREIKLEEGLIRARLQPTSNSEELSIQTPQGTLRMDSETGGVQIETSLKDGKMKISVASGSANFTPANKKIDSINIQKNQLIEASKGQVSSPQKFKPTIPVLSPEASANISVNENQNNKIKFTWSAVEEGASYQWKLYADAKAETLLLKKSTPETQIELAYIDVGTVYWRIESTIDEILYQSPLRRLNVQKHNN